MTTQTLLDFDLSESSDDSDFRIEDHAEESDDCSLDSNDERSEKDDGEDSDESSDAEVYDFVNFQRKDNNIENVSTAKLLEKSLSKDAFEKTQAKLLTKSICCACLGDRSDDANEIVECDNCGISVHEGCYGISDSNSVSSTVSSCSTEPWFCEACKANISDPVCELCPNKGGIFKETDVGKWVHQVCALYVPGVAFGEVDHLSSVTLFEMPYSKWGAKTCSLCDDARFARCGVCIGCDAGMCKTFFHVTCAQAAGLLQPFEAHSEEADHADPFYAHCKIHSDKTLIKHRKRNYNALHMRMSYRNANSEQIKSQNTSPEQKRIERKLKKHRNKYISNKAIKNEPWVPTQKIPRLLTTSASACRRLLGKAEQMGIDVAALEFQEAQIASLNDVRKKWHIPPAFSVEFIGYYLDRISRTKDVKKNLQEQVGLNKTLMSQQQTLREKYDEAIASRSQQAALKSELVSKIEHLHSAIRALCPSKSLVTVDNIICPPLKTSTPKQTPSSVPARPMSVPTAAALKMGVGFPLTIPGSNDHTNRILSTQCQNKNELMHTCGICQRVNDQHLLTKCDTCHLHYHLGCLNPPLTRPPKKSKIYAWQCSECDEDNPEGVVQLTSGPRKSRTKYSKDGTIVPVDSSRDVSMDESADDVQSTKSPDSTKSTPVRKAARKRERAEKTSIDENKVGLRSNVVSPVLSNSSMNDSTSKLDLTKSPPKKKAAKKSNLDKVIEAVSRGILCKEELVLKDGGSKPKKSKQTVNSQIAPQGNGVSEAANGTKTDQPLSPSPRKSPKTSKKAKKDKVVESPAEKEKSKVEVKVNKSETSKDKTKEKQKTKRKAKDKSTSRVESKCGSVKAEVKEVKVEAENTAEDAKIKANGEVRLERINIPDGTVVLSNDNMMDSIKLSTNASAAEQNRKPVPMETSDSIISTQNGDGTSVDRKQSRKRHRKEKHRSKHGSDAERSSSKEHKKKRKRKSHDCENPAGFADGVPKIKIKFKPLPGETATEAHCFFVPATMVRPKDFGRTRPASVNSVDDATTTPISSPKSPPPKSPWNQNASSKEPDAPKSTGKISVRTRRLSVLLSPVKATAKRRTSTPVTTISSNWTDANEIQTCDVCQVSGTSQDLVKCDECKKNYHFRCLEPPLKKTPKKRGYSWHCADCDPTDKEDN